MNLKNLSKIIIIIAALAGGFLALPSYAQTNTNFTPLNPLDNLEVKIPGLDQLAQQNPADCSVDSNNETSCKIPWISIYITAIYNYGMAIIGILAAIGMMIGGVLWTISSGNASRVKEAQSWVESSLLGLLLALGSYMILDQINPSLTTFKPIKLSIIAGDEFSTPVDEQQTAPDSLGSVHGVQWYLQCSAAGMNTLYNDKKGECKPSAGETKKYGAGKAPNICTSGCGVVATMMAMSKYGQNPSMAQFAQDAIDSGARETFDGNNCNGSAPAGLIAAAAKYGFQGEMLSNKNDIKAKLDQGYPVVISVRNTGGNCGFTTGGHFIVLTGWKDKEKGIADVNDPFNGSGKASKTSTDLSTLNGCSLGTAFYLHQ
jgi:hypothetical protein